MIDHLYWVVVFREAWVEWAYPVMKQQEEENGQQQQQEQENGEQQEEEHGDEQEEEHGEPIQVAHQEQLVLYPIREALMYQEQLTYQNQYDQKQQDNLVPVLVFLRFPDDQNPGIGIHQLLLIAYSNEHGKNLSSFFSLYQNLSDQELL